MYVSTKENGLWFFSRQESAYVNKQISSGYLPICEFLTIFMILSELKSNYQGDDSLNWRTNNASVNVTLLSDSYKIYLYPGEAQEWVQGLLKEGCIL